MYHQTNFANKQDDTRASIAVFWGGLWVAIGAFGVVITSILYVAAPALAVLPVANVIILMHSGPPSRVSNGW